MEISGGVGRMVGLRCGCACLNEGKLVAEKLVIWSKLRKSIASRANECLYASVHRGEGSNGCDGRRVERRMSKSTLNL